MMESYHSIAESPSFMHVSSLKFGSPDVLFQGSALRLVSLSPMAAQVWESKTYPSSCEAATSPAGTGQDFLFNNNYVEKVDIPCVTGWNCTRPSKAINSWQLLDFWKLCGHKARLLVPGSAVIVVVVVVLRGGCLSTWKSGRTSYVQPSSSRPTGRPRGHCFPSCFGKGLYRWVWIWQSCHRFLCWCSFGCVFYFSTLVSGNACSLQTFLLFYQILTYHQLVGTHISLARGSFFWRWFSPG